MLTLLILIIFQVIKLIIHNKIIEIIIINKL